MTESIDIAPLLDEGRWTRYQQLLTALAALAILFDGFDIQILGFAIPSLMKEWGVARGVFGPILALGLGGMVAGSAVAGNLGDRYGRRPALIGCVLVFGAATLATAFVHSVAALAILRCVCGFGTGGALPNVGALVAEFAPLNRRALAVKLTIVCVPLGGMTGGLMASRVLPTFGWRALYEIGGSLPIFVAVLLWRAMPESPRFLAQHRGRWRELTELLTRLGRGVPADSPFRPSLFHDSRELAAPGGSQVRALFGPSLARDTMGLWIAFLFCLGSIYLVFGWLPAMLTAEGANLAYASEGLAIYNFGGVAGVLLWAALITARGSRRPLLVAALFSAISALLILLVPAPAHSAGIPMLAAIGLNGLLANALQTSLYAVAAHVYPTAVRASGIAWAAAIGRAGGVVSSVFGASVIASGAAAYWGAIAFAMALAFVGVAVIAGHIPAPQKYKAVQRSV